MSTSNFLEFQATVGDDVIPGVWKLAPGRALSMLPRQAGVLRVAQGQVWVTLDVPHQGAGNALGDYFLHAGDQLAVRPGQHLVLESLAMAQPQGAASFEWVPSQEGVQTAAINNEGAVTRPLRDLGLALGMVGTALVHLGSGVLAYARQMVLGRPVVQAPHCS